MLLAIFWPGLIPHLPHAARSISMINGLLERKKVENDNAAEKKKTRVTVYFLTLKES